MIRPQYIYKAVNFIFENNSPPKEKFFVVFHSDEDAILLFSLTTSQTKIPADLDGPDAEGCVQFNGKRSYAHAFICNAGNKIGTNQFAFPKRTYVQPEFKAQLKEVAVSDINSLATSQLIECYQLIDSVFFELLRCLIQSRYLKQKHKNVFGN